MRNMFELVLDALWQKFKNPATAVHPMGNRRDRERQEDDRNIERVATELRRTSKYTRVAHSETELFLKADEARKFCALPVSLRI